MRFTRAIRHSGRMPIFSRFETDDSNSDRGFHLEYESIGCGGILSKPEGVFSTPNYPKPYPLDTECLWTIQVDYGHLIEITFHDFDFDGIFGCLDGVIVSWTVSVCVECHDFGSLPSFRSKTKLMIQSQSHICVAICIRHLASWHRIGTKSSWSSSVMCRTRDTVLLPHIGRFHWVSLD